MEMVTTLAMLTLETMLEATEKDMMVVMILLVATLAMVLVTMVCLLYTSPSPRDKRQSRMPSSA